MPRDVLGWRARIGIVGPSTNTILQPDTEALRPDGVTNHFSRIATPRMALSSDADFARLVEALVETVGPAVDLCRDAEPDRMILGVSALAFWGGRQAVAERIAALEARAGCAVTAGSTALEEALHRLGAGRIAVLSPYFPVMDDQIAGFFEEGGLTVAGLRALRCPSPHAIARVDAATLRAAVAELDGERIDAIVQVGTNLAMRSVAEEASAALGKPVLAVNAVTYRHALAGLGAATRSSTPEA